MSEKKNEIALLEIEPGILALFSEQPIEVGSTLDLLGHGQELQVMPFMVPDQLRSEFNQALGTAAGLANLGIQTSLKSQGLVRLAPQTIEALKHNKPMTDGVYNLGVLIGKNKKITEHIRWLPADGAAVASNMGPAAALLALQLQLNEISRKVDTNIELTKGIAMDLASNRVAELYGILRAVQKAWYETQNVGMSTNKIFGLVNSYGKDIEQHRYSFKSRVSQYYEALLDPQKARKYALENAQGIEEDVSCLLLIEEAWFYWQVMRGLNLSIEDSNLEENQKTLEVHNRVTMEERRGSLRMMTDVIETLEDQLKLLETVQKNFKIDKVPVLGNRSKSKAHSLHELGEQIASFAMGSYVPQEEIRPIVKWVEGKEDPDLMTFIQYSLPRRTPVLAVMKARKDRIAIVTDKELIIYSKSALEKGGEALSSDQLHDIRYVRSRATSENRYLVQVITTTRNIDLEFTVSPDDPSGAADLETFADMLKTAMNLPEAEKAQNSLILDPPKSRVELKMIEPSRGSC